MSFNGYMTIVKQNHYYLPSSLKTLAQKCFSMPMPTKYAQIGVLRLFVLAPTMNNFWFDPSVYVLASFWHLVEKSPIVYSLKHILVKIFLDSEITRILLLLKIQKIPFYKCTGSKRIRRGKMRRKCFQGNRKTCQFALIAHLGALYYR